jgi:hypothetical protein
MDIGRTDLVPSFIQECQVAKPEPQVIGGSDCCSETEPALLVSSAPLIEQRSARWCPGVPRVSPLPFVEIPEYRLDELTGAPVDQQREPLGKLAGSELLSGEAWTLLSRAKRATAMSRSGQASSEVIIPCPTELVEITSKSSLNGHFSSRQYVYILESQKPGGVTRRVGCP